MCTKAPKAFHSTSYIEEEVDTYIEHVYKSTKVQKHVLKHELHRERGGHIHRACVQKYKSMPYSTSYIEEEDACLALI